MTHNRDLGSPSALELLRQELARLISRRIGEELSPPEEARYLRLCRLEEKLLDAQAS
jgi:hypothetical protein